MKTIIHSLFFSLFSFTSFGQIDTCNVAGYDGFIQVCPDEAFNLFSGLSGPFDSTGIWYTPTMNVGPNYYPDGLSISGQYPYTYLNTHPGCPEDTAIVIVEVLPQSACSNFISEQETIEGISISPNPVTDVLVLRNENSKENLHYIIYSVDGTLIASEAIGTSSQQKISVKLFQSGVYLIVVKDANRQSIFRIVKE